MICLGTNGEKKKTVFILSLPETSVSVAHVPETSVRDSILKWKLGRPTEFLCEKMALKYIYFHVSSSLESFVISSTVEALVSDHLGNSEKWSQLELVAYENGLS